MKIKLRYFAPKDFSQLISWIDSPEFLLQWGGTQFRFPLDDHQLESYLREGEPKDDPSRLIYSVEEAETGKVIGHISLGKIDQRNKSARIGKVLVGDPSVRGKGIGEKMMKAILEIAFKELHLHRVSLGVFEHNAAAIACYEKVGFVKEGLLRDKCKIGDEYWSLWEMSMLLHEWAEA
ncbi:MULTISPECIES: GNAT family N-acetyltransferase [Bacillaceae]|uniref:GNAT family N-acetyltransferase n=1 Tax=Evansella alkalicola TaxID=745819 RepID=A0ABS6K0Q1_9BACI|nr:MULTISPECIES: GNAT family protein [Bacillaceae]MBU9724240.1 GNAT family N-acetyltransferase [Bacillus alkalicola]